MALSGSVSTNTGMDGRYYKLSWTATQSIANNTSTISWTLDAVGAGSRWEAERTVYVNIDGASVYSKTAYVERYAGRVASGTKTITHNTDGSKSFAVSLGAAVYYSSVTCTGSATFSLNTIARASGLTVSNGTLGTAQTLTADRKASSFTHTLTWTCGSYSGTIATKSTATSWSFTPEIKLASGAPNGTQVYCSFTLTTYNGSTTVGSVTKSVWLTIPSSVKPSISSITVADGKGYLATYGGYIQGQSTLQITVNAAGANGSSISSYSTSANGSTYGSNQFTTGPIKNSGTVTISSTVKDSRGRSASLSKSVTVIAYSIPKITQLKVQRCNQDGSANDLGSYAKITFTYSVTSLSNKNSNTCVLKYKQSSATAWTSVTVTPTSYNMTYSGVFAMDEGHSYDVSVTVTDAFTSASAATSVSTGYCLYHIPSSGKGITFGGIAESDGFNVKMESEFTDDVSVKDALYMGGAGGSLSDAEKAISFQNTANATNKHNVKIFGGDSGSQVACGIQDVKNNRRVWDYNDSANKVTVGPLTHFENGITETIQVQPSGNCNDLTTSGNYYIGVNGTNRPVVINGWLTVKSFGDQNTCYQEFVTYQGERYQRWRTNGTWSAWTRDYGQKLLWEGNVYMNGSQTATLAEKVSAQQNGIVLVFARFVSDTTNPVDQFNCHFVPKMAVSLQGGKGFSFHITDHWNQGVKYLYIQDAKIIGNANNSVSKTVGGSTYTNNYYVMRYVIGV